MSNVTCTATRKDGSPCTVRALASGYCTFHDPALRETTREARRAGGRNSSNAARAAKRIPRDLGDLSRRLFEALDEVHRGDLDPKRATAMASLAGAAIRVHEVAELELRLAALEERAAVQPRGATNRRSW